MSNGPKSARTCSTTVPTGGRPRRVSGRADASASLSALAHGAVPAGTAVVHIVAQSKASGAKVRRARGAQMVDLDRGVGGDLHVAARHHRRERRAARHPALTSLLLLRSAVDRQRLLADAGR